VGQECSVLPTTAHIVDDEHSVRKAVGRLLWSAGMKLSFYISACCSSRARMLAPGWSSEGARRSRPRWRRRRQGLMKHIPDHDLGELHDQCPQLLVLLEQLIDRECRRCIASSDAVVPRRLWSGHVGTLRADPTMRDSARCVIEGSGSGSMASLPQLSKFLPHLR